MTWVPGGDPFFQLCTGYERSSWRWECQGVYHEPDEVEPFQLWRDRRPDNSFLTGWLSTVRRLRAAGKTFERVRMVTDPPTEYLRWMFSFTQLNIDAGEDIRWVDERQARQAGMPGYDFYLFDDKRVAIITFDNGGVVGAEVTDDTDVVDQHVRWREVMWPLAARHEESQYATRSM